MSNSCTYTNCSYSWQASLMRSLDSYFDFSGIRERIVLIDSNGLTLAKEEHTEVSTTVKILKIISFIIFFPLVIVALAIRYLLHKKFDRKYIYLPMTMTEHEERILIANPGLVKEAALTVVPLFYFTPKKYQVIKFEALEGQAPKVAFSINTELLLEDLKVETINWPTLHLYDDLDFAGHPEEKTLIDKIREIEGKDSKQMSLESKRLLALHFLECICTQQPSLDPTEDGIIHSVRLPYTYDENVCGGEKTIWHEIYFMQTGSIHRDSPGTMVYDRLLELGFFWGDQCLPVARQYSVSFSQFRFIFPPKRIDVLKVAGFLPKTPTRK
ncbi:Family of unknown function (DUF648) [Chlamydia serpentis]|uniref:Uncharacterized protein n=1 Tax=Chlamydia serpentis TaxID=1967782 RepID=A0A2R8FA75_9CHLA|nr:DUF648 domain-containing protein [Chlamydia serpentis]SPN73323.1 Family of unknown function (DUF648) [Chlamydia serpentis]